MAFRPMQQPDAARAVHLDAMPRDLSLRRLHSLSGVIPLGVFLVAHIALNARGMAGEVAYERASSAVSRIPLWIAIEVVGIVLPLAFHAIYGVKLAFQTSSRGARHRYGSNGLYLAERLSGLLALLFIAFHLWEFWFDKVLGRVEKDAFYGLLSAHLSSTWSGVPVIAILYLVGIAAVSFHFANGLFATSRLFGIFRADKDEPAGARQRALSALYVVVGLAIFLTGTMTTIYFATGLRFSPFESHTSVAEPRCSVIDRADQMQAPRPGPSSPQNPSATRKR
jgi:succinate dehydrogenase / fumarate reductase cytochrome b subunit